MTTPEIVRLERIVAELRDELARKEELKEQEIKHLTTNLENVTSELHGLTRRFENHYHDSFENGRSLIRESDSNHLWTEEEWTRNMIESGRY